MTNAFQKAEDICTEKTLKLLGHKYNLDRSADQFEVWDFSGVTQSLEAEDKSFFIEVKNRDIKSTTYDSIYMELSKFQSLIEVADSNDNADCFYLNFFTDNIALIFNLRKLRLCEVKFQSVITSKTTADNKERLVDKLMIALPVNQAAKKYKIN